MIVKLFKQEDKINYLCFSNLLEKARIYEKEIINQYKKREKDYLFNIEKCNQFRKDYLCKYKIACKKFDTRCEHV